MKHIKYLRYLLRHKWFVLVECWKRGLIWRGLVHDLSKFIPSEWNAYAEYFYGDLRSTEWFDLYARYSGVPELAPWGESIEDRFNLAWLLHQHRNPHHWQYWLLKQDDGGPHIILPMPEQYRTEMLCDWIGAGKAMGKPDTKAWYLANRDNIVLHSTTEEWIERELGVSPLISR